MSKKYILSIDAGTTGITIIIIDYNGQPLKKYYSEFNQIYPKPGWVEHNAQEIWNITEQLILSAFIDFDPINCNGIGITNQRETTVIWNKKTNKPIFNAIVWQCRRTVETCNTLIESGLQATIQNKTGLIIDSYFSGTKIKWILDNIDGARLQASKGELAFGTIDTWLLWMLTGGKNHATDYTNASRTMIYNIKAMKWDKELLEMLNIPINILPEVKSSSGEFGMTKKNLFKYQIKITGIAGDQQAALFGQQCYNVGETKCTYGTGCFLLTNTGKNKVISKSGLITTIACDHNGSPVYALEGSVFIGGAVIQWLRDELKLISNAKSTDKIATSIKDTNGVVIVPAFTGLGAPYWNSEIKGSIFGITRGTNRKHLIRASLESIGFQVKDLINCIEQDMNNKINSLKVDGGAVSNNFLMQFQSDILNIPISKPNNIESTAMGAGMLAGIGSGFWDNTKQIKTLSEKQTTFYYPKIKNDKRAQLLKEWDLAIKRASIKIK